MVQEMSKEMSQATEHEAPVPRISARFHETLAAWVVEVALKTGIRRAALSGGCFQNAWLTARCAARLEAAGCAVFIHQRVPANDGGISLGQAVLAASRISR
jgi:hydrogenase maturation protein HypF